MATIIGAILLLQGKARQPLRPEEVLKNHRISESEELMHGRRDLDKNSFESKDCNLGSLLLRAFSYFLFIKHSLHQYSHLLVFVWPSTNTGKSSSLFLPQLLQIGLLLVIDVSVT